MHPPIRLARSARASARHATRPKGSDHAGSTALEAGAAVLAARRAPRMRCALWNGSRSSPRRRPSKRKLRSSPAADERRCPKPSTRLWLRLARAAEVWSAPPQERTAGMRRTSGTQPGARTLPDATGARSPAPPAILPASRTATARRSPPAGACYARARLLSNATRGEHVQQQGSSVQITATEKLRLDGHLRLRLRTSVQAPTSHGIRTRHKADRTKAAGGSGRAS